MQEDPQSALVTGMGMDRIIVHGDKLSEAWKLAIEQHVLGQAGISQVLLESERWKMKHFLMCTPPCLCLLFLEKLCFVEHLTEQCP